MAGRKKNTSQQKSHVSLQNITLRDIFTTATAPSLTVGIATLLIIAIFSYILGSKQVFNTVFTKKAPQGEKVEKVTLKNLCDEEQSIQHVKDSVVRIIGTQSEGTGFVVGETGYILTNYHVVKSDNLVRIVFPDNTPVIGKIFNWDEQADLAVIKIEKTNLKPLAFADSDKLLVGQTVYTLGFPLGRMIPGEATVTKGIYSAKRASDVAGVEYLQIDANLNKGNSGSPIIESCGTVVGILSMSIEGSEGLKFAISSKTAKSLSDSLIATGPKQAVVVGGLYADDQTLPGVVGQFYNYISTRQLALAYGLLSKNFQKYVGGFNNFSNGYNNTLNVYLQDVWLYDPSVNSVYVKVATADVIGDKVLFRVFEGTWKMVQEDGIWKLDAATIRQI